MHNSIQQNKRIQNKARDDDGTLCIYFIYIVANRCKHSWPFSILIARTVHETIPQTLHVTIFFFVFF